LVPPAVPWRPSAIAWSLVARRLRAPAVVALGSVGRARRERPARDVARVARSESRLERERSARIRDAVLAPTAQGTAFVREEEEPRQHRERDRRDRDEGSAHEALLEAEHVSSPRESSSVLALVIGCS